MTPDELRELPDAFDIPAVAGDYIRAAADAWEADKEDLDDALRAISELTVEYGKRLEAAERLIARIEEWDGKLVRDCRAALAGETERGA